MKKIGIVTNMQKDKDLFVTKELAKILKENNFEVILPLKTGNLIENSYSVISIENLYKEAEMVIVLGGDGTLLNTARQCASFNKPILGINLGNLGFLVEAEATMIPEVVEKIKNNEFTLEKRMMIEADIENEPLPQAPYIALNDIGITRSAFSRIIRLELYVNDEYVDSFPADGLIISTPTGSTAYNLSAGGPIVHPTIEEMIITPICPHTLHARSFIVSHKDEVKVKVMNESSNDIVLTIDGQMGYNLKKDDIIRIKKSKYQTTLVRVFHRGFYEVLRSKINKNR